MNSFKLFNRTNKNDIVSNNLNGIEHKEKDRSKPNHKKNKSNTSTPSRNNLGNNQIENENEKDNKENVVGLGLSSEKDNQHQSTTNKENQVELPKKEKNKKMSKKEKRKNKKNKKSKAEHDKKDNVSSTKANIMETFKNNSSSSSKKDSLTGKYTGKQQPSHKQFEAPVQPVNLIKNYNEATQFQHEPIDIKEKQSRMDYTSDHTSDTAREKEKFIRLVERPERIESRNISGINNKLTPLIPITQEDNAVIGKQNENSHDNAPSSTTLTTPKEVTKESQFRFNFDNDSLLNLTFPICLGMTTPSSSAFSCITPINGAESCNNSLGGEEVDNLLSANKDVTNNGDGHSSNHSRKLSSVLTEEKTDDKHQNVTEQDQSSQPSVTEIKTREIPIEFIPKTSDVIDEFHQEKSYKKGKEKQKQKVSKHSKKKEKKNNVHLSINTKIDQELSVSNSSSSVPSPTKGNYNALSPNGHSSETKKKAWSSFRKLFGKKNGRKTYYRNSLTESIDENLRGNYNTGVMYDWEELRRRMELEENSTVCTESLSAREFAEVVGIPIISSSDEEDDQRIDTESEMSLGAARTTHSLLAPTHSLYGHTHRSTKSSGPALDMSIFIPPTEEEKKKIFAKNESTLSREIYNSSVNTASSFASSTTQDYLDRLGGDLKRKVFDDSHSVSHRELNMFNGPNHLHQKITDNESLTLPIHRYDHAHEFPTVSVIDDSHFTPTEIDHISPPISKPLKSKTSWLSANDKVRSNTSTNMNNGLSDNNLKRDRSFTDSKSISQKEINLKDGINHQSHKSLCSFELKNISHPECPKTDVRNRISFNSNVSQLEESHTKPISKELSQKSEGIPSLGRRSPSISSVRTNKTYSPDSMVQEFQKGRFTVTKPIYPNNNGHRVFIVTKDEEDENGDSITTISSISSSPQKAAFRKRSCSQPAAFLSSELDKRVTSSHLKLSSSIPDNDEFFKQRDIVIQPNKSNSLMAGTNINRRKSTVSLDPSMLNNGYDLEDSEDNSSDHLSITKTDSRSEKGKNVIYSRDANNSSSSSLTLSPTVSPLHPYKPKKSNSRFQVTYTPGVLSPSSSICSKKSFESSKIKSQRLLNDDTSSVEQTPKHCPYLTEMETEPIDFSNRIFYNNNLIERDRLGRPASNHSLALSTSANVNTNNSTQQSLNNVNQRTVGSISSVLTENGIHSNVSSPALSSAKQSPYHNGIKPLSIITSSSVDTNNNDTNLHNDIQDNDISNNNDSNNNSSSLNEKSNTLENSSFSVPSPHKILETNSDYFNFFKYNDSYNSIILSCCSKDNDKVEKETTENILDAMDKTEDNEILSEMDKTNDLSESSPSTPYYHHISTQMEKPPVIPNSPISYKSISSMNNNNTLEENVSILGKLPMEGNNSSNESFTIFDRDINSPGDSSFNEGHSVSLARQNSKNSSLTTPTLKSSHVVSKNTSSLSMRSNFGHYRSPSTSSTNTNGSSRFTVTRESNDAHSPSYSASKVRRLSNLHSFTPITNDQSLMNDTTQSTTSTTATSTKLKPSMVVVKKSDDKPIIISGTVTTSTESKNVGRFTVTRETVIPN